MIRKELLNYIFEFDDPEQVFLLLTHLRHPETKFGNMVSANSLFKLIQDSVIDKDYITSSFNLLVPYYDSDEGNVIPSTNYNNIEQQVIENVDHYRSLFKGYRVGSMGNKQECINKLTRFIVMHNTDFDTIIRATMYYLEKESPEYVMNADNFISNEKGSKLAIVMDEMPSSRLL